MLSQRILKDTLSLRWEPYWPNGGGTIAIYPHDEPGIQINWVTVSQSNLRAQQSMWARFLVVTDASWVPVAKVVEHLLSALHGAWIQWASIKTPLWVPVIGAWIEWIYNPLMDGSKELSGYTRKPAYIYSTLEFQSSDGCCTLRVSPNDTLDLSIERKLDPEIGVDSSIRIPDLYAAMQSSSSGRLARPIARVRNPIINTIQKVIEVTGGRGVSSSNYIFNRPKFSQGDIISQMWGVFQPEHNEHLAHTAFADFFGELHTYFPHGLIWKLEFRWKNNHITRLELLQKLQLAYLYK